MRKSKVVIAVLVSFLAISQNVAYAAKSGSKSESASAAWLVNGLNTGCNGTSPTNLTDNYVDNDSAYVWIKSSASVNVENIWWYSYDKGNAISYGDLDYTGYYCGQFVLMAFDVYADEALILSNPLSGVGSITFKFDYNGKSFTADTAQLY